MKRLSSASASLRLALLPLALLAGSACGGGAAPAAPPVSVAPVPATSASQAAPRLPIRWAPSLGTPAPPAFHPAVAQVSGWRAGITVWLLERHQVLFVPV